MGERSAGDVYDVVVIGSGAAGLSAALSARATGASVCVLERSGKFGGTTAMSGGVIWIPLNTRMADVGAADTREEALTYLEALSLGRLDRALAEVFVDTGPQVVDFLERETSLRFRALKLPDYQPEHPGGTHGRALVADPVKGGDLGDLRAKLRPAPQFPAPITLYDLEVAHETGIDFLNSDTLLQRIQGDEVALGAGLAAGLLTAADRSGVTLETDRRVRRLIKEDGRVTGMVAETPEGERRYGARRGVVIASGGYEHNAELTAEFLRGPLTGASSNPNNEGDGLLMAIDAGASLGNMSEAWWIPVMQIPGETNEGRTFWRITTVERCMPGGIMVNRYGRRFVNEAHNYNDIGRSFHSFDPVRFDFTNVPAWVVFHQPRLDAYPFLTHFPGDPIPNWLTSAPTLRELACKIGIDADELERTVDRFNAYAAEGRDPDFQRGESVYDLYHADHGRPGALATLGPVETAPFYAMPVHPGSLGTKGGPKTNARGEVLGVFGDVIPGLFAAGNASASAFGMAYPGAGGTLGPALVFGHLAGRTAGAANTAAVGGDLAFSRA